ncbi:MAG: membrane protein [Phycisphaerae bacterium]|nr:MAG: membrane protein [Phycisphaerae bacterium]
MRFRLSIPLIAAVMLLGCERRTADTRGAQLTNDEQKEFLQAPATKESTSSDGEQALVTVKQVDLKRYMGQWYEIARYPSVFQKGIVGVIAEYRLRNDGRIDVINSGFVKSLDGRSDRSESIGWVVEKSRNAKWKVQFIWPFSVPYWIIDLGDDYEYAVVGQPSRKYLWVLSRTPQMDDETYDGICQRLAKQGYDPARLQKTPQPSGFD